MTDPAMPARDPRLYRTLVRRALAVFGLCVAAALAAAALKPTREIATFKSERLEAVIPKAFGDWRIDASVVPVLPNPETLASLSRIYSETLARTYVNSQGDRVMLSLAYGRRQDDTMRLHEPEGCYTGQGFGVRRLGQQPLSIGGRSFLVMRLHATMDRREEPITYWMVIGGGHAVTQAQAKIAQLRFGLRGFVPDGLLVRLSSITSDTAAAFRMQDSFVRDLVAAVPADVGAGLLGS